MPRIVIDDRNWEEFAGDVIIDGHRMGRGMDHDYEADPSAVGSVEGVEPFDLPLIPRDEWSDRIAHMIETRSRLSDIRDRANDGYQIPSYDQNGQGYCVTEDTEVLTSSGWVQFPNYNWSDPIGTVNPVTQQLEFQRPFQKHIYEYDGPIIGSTNRRLDFAVTPDHQMYVRKWNERKRTLDNQYSFVRAEDIGWYAGFMAAPRAQIGADIVELEIPGDGRYDGDDFFALLGLIISDGYVGTPGTKTENWVSFASYRDDLRSVVQGLAIRTGMPQKPSDSSIFIRYSAGALARWIRENCYSSDRLGAINKRVPQLVKCASPRQIRIFLHWFDDRNRDGSQFYSVSKGLIDDLQELHLRIGVRCTIGKRPAKSTPFSGNKNGEIRGRESYVLTVASRDNLCIERKKHIDTDRYKGLVYCAAVPNHTMITRRNGSVLISSNCWAYSTGAAITISRAVANMPYHRLSCHAVACKIKNFRDEGGWNPLSVEFGMKHGYPTIETWPEKSMNRRNDNDQTWAEAKNYRITEGFMQLTPPVYDRNLTFDQLMTCLLMRIPCPVDLMWWRHSVCALDPLEYDKRLSLNDPNRWGIGIWNSWRDAWGTNGYGEIRGRKAVPDGATAIKVVIHD